MQLDVILRTHDRGSVHTYAPRIVDCSKAEIVRRCVLSLVRALSSVEHTLTILDDHSSKATVSFLSSIGELVHVGPGNNASLIEAVKRARESRASLVYLIEDDYLHSPDAINLMLGFVERAKSRGVPQVAVHPYDDADNYGGQGLRMACRVVDGDDRPWRTNNYSTGSVMTSPSVFAEPEWEHLARNYNSSTVHEGTTINRIWEGRATLFSPLPSLAVHLNHNLPLFVDWRSWWNAIGEDHADLRAA